jgi:short-subunit dehydrogenase
MKTYKSYSGKTVLITGAFGGFGQKFIKKMLLSDAKVILTDIVDKPITDVLKEEGIPDKYKKNVLGTIVVNLVDKEGPKELYDKCNKIAPVDVVIHNAGMAFGGYYQDIPYEKIQLMMAVMVNGPMELTHLFLPDFIKRKSGQFVFISSVAGVVSTFYSLGYTSAKFAIKSFGTALSQETKKTGIKVSVVYPFFTKTKILKALTFGKAPIPPMPKQFIGDPDKVIDEAMAGMNKNKLHIRPGFYSKMMYNVSRLYPVTGPLMILKDRKKN